MIKLKNVVFLISYIIGFVGFLSVLPFVGGIYTFIFLLMFFAGIATDFKYIKPFPRYILNVFSLLVVLSLTVKIDVDNMVIPVVETLLLLLGVKFLENKEFRDFMQIYVISVFLLAGSALLSIDITFMLYFMVIFFGTVISVILLTYYTQDGDILLDRRTFVRIIAGSSLIPVIAVPITVLIFILLPRTQYPVFNFLNMAGKGKTGFSDTVQLGDVSEIQEDSSIAIRVKTDSRLEPENVYIRGLVLNFFDGRRWFRRNIEEDSRIIGGKTVKQEIILEPTGNRYLPSIDIPSKVYYKATARGDRIFISGRRIFSRIKYSAVSVVGGYIVSTHINRNFYLQVPPKIDRRVYRLAKKLKGKTAEETVLNTVNYLKKNYRYSLKNLKISSSPLSQFLFDEKSGNCEFFASAAAVILRINGIPTRVVAGFRGMKYNKIADYYSVPNRFAHTWIEVYIDGRWIRYDPTPSSPVIRESKDISPFLESVKQILDAIEYAYISSIVNFDIRKQITVFKNLKNLMLPSDIGSFLSYLKFAVFFLIFGIFIFYAVKSLNISYEERLLKQFLKKMKKYGYERNKNEGLEEFVKRVKEESLRKKATEFVRVFEEIYYRDRRLDRKNFKRLSSLIRNI
ncbi:DUF3488 domain-containing transglutaminase family protein [Persephonella atlantica]|uniref:DUF3488 domain-containing transglutaminase family protein n=1 Tax=Persephonella atlantica TaxID=2699429 RepID=A0ABS1GFT5_9AQUI|nr:DUF3488 and transglutaminase-like domain-containing protein [Persephonella atlantica]MBK3331786.1 DUF3488 domain-containing transglutaminase family protein [Persephonella atlantica]